jgi:hypothetical protein
MTIPIRRAVARLMRVAGGTTNRRWYVPRDVLKDKPFFPAAEGPCIETLQLQYPVPWPMVDASYIRRLIHDRFS